MAARSSPVGFGVFDLLTRITPGAIFWSIISGGIILQSPSIPTENTTILFAIFLTLSLIAGEAINYLNNSLFLPPTAFRRFLHEAGIEVDLGIIDSFRQGFPWTSEGSSLVNTIAGEQFPVLFREQFNIPKDYTDTSDIYQILLGYMGPRLSPRTKRQRVVYHFVNNTLSAIYIGAFILFGKLAIESLSNNVQDTTLVWSIVVSIVSIAVVYSLTFIFGLQEEDYVNNLIIEYYIDRVEAGMVDELDESVVQQTIDEVKQDR